MEPLALSVRCLIDKTVLYSTAFLVLLGFLPGSILAGSNSGCPGYAASHITTTPTGLSAILTLAGTPCNIYGQDLKDLKLQVEYQSETRLHVKIYDAAENVYQVPNSVFPRPASGGGTARGAAIAFSYTSSPFSFAVQRKATAETIFNSSGSDLIFESQYLRLRTSLPPNPNLYGLGEHTDPLRLNTTNYTRTLWSRDAYEIPPGTNLYGNHPVYFENRGHSQTHGVFLLNSNGMDIKINNTSADGQYLEYNTLGGVIDLYFLAGPSPLDVARQYSEIAGAPAMQPYWGLGFHQCRFGYQDVFEVAGVVANYSAADIPLETMWTDIDYMDARKVFTVDPQRFPLAKVRELVDYLHQHGQHYIVMVDPAVAYQNYSAFNNGADQGIFLRFTNGSIYKGVVWPGVTAFPDWFNPDTQAYWNGEFDTFFNADTGVDIDALWIDMNEPANSCIYPCSDPEGYAKENKLPPMPPAVRNSSPIPLPGFPPDFQPPRGHRKRVSTSGRMQGLPGRDLINPPYTIQNEAGSLSNKTLNTDLVHAGEGYVEYDTHNLYGTMMSSASRGAMLSRRPTLKPMIITRSTFAGAGKDVGHWLGDNAATWYDYRISIAEQLAFAAIYQVPMVGSDVCGFEQNSTETLCARWAMLGAFSPFYRNHNEQGTIGQEFYRWPTVAEAARNAISIRYRLLDYLYTAMHQQSVDGTPLLNPLWYLYPNDPQTASVDLQFFFGSAVLVSPVTAENATSVSIYLPHDIFYDFYTYAPFHGSASNINLTDIGFTSIPLHIRGGTIIPMRVASANTTAALRKNDFRILIAPAADGTASGSLYLDDGVSLVQTHTSHISFHWSGTHFSMSGNFSYDPGSVKIAELVVLGTQTAPSTIQVYGKPLRSFASSFNQSSGALTVRLNAPLTHGLEMDITPPAGGGSTQSIVQIADGQIRLQNDAATQS